MIKWGRSDDGFIDSKCGQFRLVPKWWGRVNPQEYVVEHQEDDKWVRIASGDTQKEAKRYAEDWVHQERIRNAR